MSENNFSEEIISTIELRELLSKANREGEGLVLDSAQVAAVNALLDDLSLAVLRLTLGI
jgi:hypothetical protein